MSRVLTSISLLGSLPFSHAGGVQIEMVTKLPNLCYISVSAFRAKGKVKPLKLLLSDGSFFPELARLGEAWKIALEPELQPLRNTGAIHTVAHVPRNTHILPMK